MARNTMKTKKGQDEVPASKQVRKGGGGGGNGIIRADGRANLQAGSSNEPRLRDREANGSLVRWPKP